MQCTCELEKIRVEVFYVVVDESCYNFPIRVSFREVLLATQLYYIVYR